MADERCKHHVFLTHRCRDCEAEESNDPDFQKDAKIFQLEQENKSFAEEIDRLTENLRGAITSDELLHNRIKQLEQELDQEQRKYKPDTTVEQMRETLRDSMLEHKAVITEQDKEITELKGRINKYLDIFDSINYLPPAISASHIRSMITEKLQRML